MRICALSLALLLPVALLAQDTLKPPELGWKHGVVAGLTLTQVTFTDWAQGGDNALAYTLSIDGKSTLEEQTFGWANAYKFAFGQTRLGDQGLRKTDDKIDLESVLSYKLGGLIRPYAAATFKSQFAKGFKYDANGTRTALSKFFDPAYLTQSVGALYQPIPEVKTRLGVGLREVLTTDFPAYADDPATLAVEKTRVDGGLESVTDLEWHLDDNLLLTSKLELFAPFKTLDQIVVRNDNTLAAKVGKYVTVNLNVQLINERRATPRTQVKETLALGLSYALL
jgi:hypothetical protein